MNKFKVGDKVKKLRGDCCSAKGDIIYKVQSYCGSLGIGEDPMNFCICQDDWEPITRTEITWDNLEKGDVIVDSNVRGRKSKVLAIIDDVFLLSFWDSFNEAGGWWTATQAKLTGYTLEQPKNEEVEEVTMSDVEAKFGKKVKIVKTK